MQDFQVISPDLREHGKSTASDCSDFFGASAKDLDETLESLDQHSVHLVGASLGTLVANEKGHAAIIPFASHLVHIDQPETFTQMAEVFLKGI